MISSARRRGGCAGSTKQLSSLFRGLGAAVPPPYPKARRSRWRKLVLHREDCEQLWPPASNAKAHIVEGDRQGRPSKSSEIKEAYVALKDAGGIDWEAPLTKLYAAIR